MKAEQIHRFVDAVEDLLDSIRLGEKISDDSLEILVERENQDSDRKQMLMGLKSAGLITDDQAAFAIAYRWPLREA